MNQDLAAAVVNVHFQGRGEDGRVSMPLDNEVADTVAVSCTASRLRVNQAATLSRGI